MPKHNAANERIKREYFGFLREAKGRDSATIDRVAMALARFEDSTVRKDFRKFHREQAIAFKRRLGEALNAATGDRLSKATVASILRDLKAFFEWLSREPGYRSKLHFSDADYFSPSAKDAAIARAPREKAVPTVEQVQRVLETMPAGTVLERRDRALVAFAALTGARVNALASFRLGHVDPDGGFVEQDARVVRTKFAKTFRTYFMPVCDGAAEIVAAWFEELRDGHLWGDADPLFPATAMGLGEDGGFEARGLAREAWKSTQPIRDIFQRGFAGAGLPYFNPHSLRDMLVHHAMRLDLTPAQMKAWSQNLGHEAVLTTFTSYGKVPVHRQGELIRESKAAKDGGRALDDAALIAALAERLDKTAR
ncbi:tyrosine-type recombinase/integrase [Tsuneonella rigui]|uniref:tyrosine-type recombinase/integrase n=1 Tax=Tsuneonella rigui TaxID=1708790 RepID=UPI000F7D8C9F|nr:site-specific integrase [Tsuneonella rigui]